MKFEVGDEVLVDHKVLKGHICTVTQVDPEDGYIRVYHPTKDWSGFHTGLHKEAQERFKMRKLTKLDKVLK